MDRAVLVGFPREAGWHLLRRLDAAGLEITAAYWSFDEEAEEWRLVLVSSLVGDKGPLYVIRQVQELLASMAESEREDLTLRDVVVRNPSQMSVRDLRATYGRVEDGHDLPWGRTALGRGEPYIYRLL